MSFFFLLIENIDILSDDMSYEKVVYYMIFLMIIIGYIRDIEIVIRVMFLIYFYIYIVYIVIISILFNI